MVVRAWALAMVLAVGLGGIAAAQTSTRATADLNMRSGPGTQYSVLRVIPNGSPVRVLGCNAAATWCNVNFVTAGWVSANFLSPRPTGAPVVQLPTPVPPPPPPLVPRPPQLPSLPDILFPDRIDVTGTITNQGAECQTMRGDNGQLFSLTGNLRGFRPGDRVRVRGRVAEMSFCMQGTTIEVRLITSAN
jgi:hypothetical protein